MKTEDIGINAGKIWSYLSNKNDFASVFELKFQLNLTNTELYLALGWLAREDKIVFLEEENVLKVRLK